MAILVTRYVNTDSVGGDGTTNATSGTNAAYKSLGSALTALQQEFLSLVSSDRTIAIHCSAPSGVADGAILFSTSWEMDADHGIDIYGENPTGVYDNTKYRLRSTGTRVFHASSMTRVRFHDVQFSLANTANAGPVGITCNVPNAVWELNRCIVQGVDMGGSSSQAILVDATGGGANVTLRSCVVYGAMTTGSRLVRCNGGGAVLKLFGCTIVDGVTGVQWVDGTIIARGTGTTGCTTGWSGTFSVNCSNNASSDATAPGANPRHSVVPTFVSPTGRDYHLAPGDTAWAGAGMDLTADGVTTDIDGEPPSATWNIGADQFAGNAKTAVVPGFGTNALDTTKWTASPNFSGPSTSTISVANGVLSITYPGTSTGSSEARVTSVGRYDLTESEIYVDARSVLTGASSFTYLDLQYDAGHRVLYAVEDGVLYALVYDAGLAVFTQSAPYSATEHAELRISHASGTLTWSTRRAGAAAWTPFATHAVGAGGIYDSLDDLQVVFRAGRAGTTTGGTASFAEVNTPNPVDTTAPAFASAVVPAAGTTVEVSLTETGSAPILPAAGVTGFTVSVGGQVRAITSAVRDANVNTKVVLTLTSKALSGETVTVAYTPGNVTDSASTPNAMAAFAAQPVTNNSTQTAVVADRIEWALQPSASYGVNGLVQVRLKAVQGAAGPTQTTLNSGTVVLKYNTAPSGVDKTVALDAGPWANGICDLEFNATHFGTGFTLIASDGTILDSAASSAFDTTMPSGGTVTIGGDIMQYGEAVLDVAAQSSRIRLKNSDGSDAVLTNASAGLVIRYRRGFEAWVPVAAAELASDNAAWASGGIRALGGGLHRLDLPDAAYAAATVGGSVLFLSVTATGVPEQVVEIRLGKAEGEFLTDAANKTWEHADATALTTAVNSAATNASTAATEATAAKTAANSALTAAQNAQRAALQYGVITGTTTSGTDTVVTVQRKNPDGTNMTGVEGVLELTFNASGTQISALPVGTP